MQGPDHVGGIEQCSSYVVVGAPFDCRSGGLQVGHSVPSRPAWWDADFIAHLADCDDGALEEAPLFGGRQIVNLIGRTSSAMK
jgi:hypothetical protein